MYNLKLRIMSEVKKSYIIVDELNRWLGTGINETQEQIKESVKEIRNRLKDDGEDENIDLLLYEVVGNPIHV